MNPRCIELLSPALNADIGIEAINHGADAVYIGASRFGARSHAGNSVEDIARLVSHAHLFGARVYVTLNTLLFDDELAQAQALAWELYAVGVDAFIVQDMALAELEMPPVPLHASTQADNRTVEKVQFLQAVGFEQVVLARELSLEQIRAIADATTVPLEVFIHGSLCVSYSGACNISQALAGRSANRGECAQYCRLPYTLLDGTGEVLLKNKHLLSLKDLNQTAHIEALLDAGVTSLKIEGRLKEMSYVKNITAHYRRTLDAIMLRRGEYIPASQGRSEWTFTPQPERSFNRGFTSFFLYQRPVDPVQLHTPKSMGMPVGHVKQVSSRFLTVAGTTVFANNDGLCYLNEQGVVSGFKVNRVEENKLYPADMPSVAPKTPLFRNYDHNWEGQMQRPTARRTLAVDMHLYNISQGIALTLTDETGIHVTVARWLPLEEARLAQEQQQRQQLSKLGGTPFVARDIQIDFNAPYFIPAVTLNELRRLAVERLVMARGLAHRPSQQLIERNEAPYITSSLQHPSPVTNRLAEAFYRRHGVKEVLPAYELSPQDDAVLMYSKHCVRHLLQACPHQKQHKRQLVLPLTLTYKEMSLRLDFDCGACLMTVR